MRAHDQTIGEFLDALAGRCPVPGGGATAALHVAQAAALVAMVGRYSDGPRYDAHRADIDATVTAADEARRGSVDLALHDAAAFERVADAYAAPRSTDAEREQRRAAIGKALVAASEPPAGVVAEARRVIELARGMVAIANRNLVADLAAAAEAARAAAATARVNLEVNVAGMDDAAQRERFGAVAGEVDAVLTAADEVTVLVRAEIAG